MEALIWKEGLPNMIDAKCPSYVAETDNGQYTIKPQPRGFRYSPGAGLLSNGGPFEFAGYRVEWTSKHYTLQVCEPPIATSDHRCIGNALIRTLDEAKSLAERDYMRNQKWLIGRKRA